MITFHSLGLNPSLLKAVEQLGFEVPTSVQEKVIPTLLNDQTDLVALAQTGTGKTAAFGLPMLQLIQVDASKIQGLILSPTRELCLQLTNELKQYSSNLKKINIVAVYGGANINEQSKKIKRGAHIIVATPGRLKDMIRRKLVDISAIRFCVLDEATQKAALLVAKTELISRNINEGPWTKYEPKFRIAPESYVEIRNDFINGQKLFRRIDMQGTSLNGLSEIRRLTETNTQYETGFDYSGWSTSITIDRNKLLMKETINSPIDLKGEFWTRKCSVI